MLLRRESRTNTVGAVQCSAVRGGRCRAFVLLCSAALHCAEPHSSACVRFSLRSTRCSVSGVRRSEDCSARTVDCAVFSGRCGVQLLSCVLHTTHAVQNRTEQNKTRSEWRGAARRRTWRASGLNEQHGATNWPQRVHSSRHELINSLTLCEQRGGAFTSRAIIAPIIYLFCSLILFLFLFLFSTCLSTLRLAVVAP